MDENQLRKEIDELVAEMKAKADGLNENRDTWWMVKQSALASRIGALADIVSKRTEVLTKKLVVLTWVLAFLTAALLAVEIRGMFAPKDVPALKQDKQAGNNN